MALGVLVVWLSMSSAAVAAPMLYAVSRDGRLYNVDAATGASTFVGSLGVVNSNEIEIDPLTGNAYVLFGGSQQLQQFDPLTATLIGSPVSLGAEFSGLEFVGGTLYGTGRTPGFDLAVINPTGTSTPIPHASSIAAGGLAYNTSTSTMYAIDDIFGAFYSINLATGARNDISLLPAGTHGRSLTIGSDGFLYAANREAVCTP